MNVRRQRQGVNCHRMLASFSKALIRHYASVVRGRRRSVAARVCHARESLRAEAEEIQQLHCVRGHRILSKMRTGQYTERSKNDKVLCRAGARRFAFGPYVNESGCINSDEHLPEKVRRE